MKIVFFGTEKFSQNVLAKLLEQGLIPDLVITKPDSKSGRGNKLYIPPVKELALKHNIKVLQPQKVSEIIPNIETLDNPIGVLVAYGKIIPESVLNVFKKGIINLHPSYLPKYRGPSPVESAILNEDESIGISIMKLEAKMDAGPIYSQKSLDISSLSKEEIYQEIAKIGANEFIRLLPKIYTNEIKPEDQDESQATFCKLFKKEDGFIDTQANTINKVLAHIKAMQGFPKTHVSIKGHDVIILEAHKKGTENINKKELIIPCLDGDLVIDKLITKNGKITTGEAFKNGYLK